VFFMFDRHLKRWELALMFGLLCGLLGGFWLDQEQAQLADRVIRFHVIANSDSAEDQALKLRVRDRVLAETEIFYPENATLEEAKAALEAHLEDLAAAGQEVLVESGRNELVTAHLEQCWFPTKEYDGFALPAGEYTALRVVIGEGQGQNWWCVAFPPLCLEAASETVEEAAAAGYFSPGQAALITEEDRGYVLKFKAMELLGEWKGFLFY
jgi:stage II sporulation protein R